MIRNIRLVYCYILLRVERLGRYPDRVIQKRFGQRFSGAGIVWEKPKDVDVDHYEVFISSREVNPAQVEAFCKGEVDFVKKFTFDNTVNSVIDNKTPMFRRMLYSVFAVDKAGDYVNVSFTVDDSKNSNLKNPKYIAVEEGPWGIKNPKQIAVEEGPVGVKETATVKVEEGPVGLEKGPAGVEEVSIGVEGVPKMEGGMAAAKSSQTYEATWKLLMLSFDGKKFSLPEKEGKEVEIKAISYKVVGKEGNTVEGTIVAGSPIWHLDLSYAHSEPCNIHISMPELTGLGTFLGKPISHASHQLTECRVSSLEVSYDGESLRVTYNFTAKSWTHTI